MGIIYSVNSKTDRNNFHSLLRSVVVRNNGKADLVTIMIRFKGTFLRHSNVARLFFG